MGVSSPAWGEEVIFWDSADRKGSATISDNRADFRIFVRPDTSWRTFDRIVKISFSKEFLYASPQFDFYVSCKWGHDTSICDAERIRTDPPGIYSRLIGNDANIIINNLTQNSVTITQMGVKSGEMSGWWDAKIYFSPWAQGKTFKFCLTDVTYNVGPVCKDITVPFFAPPPPPSPTLSISSSPSPMSNPILYGKEQMPVETRVFMSNSSGKLSNVTYSDNTNVTPIVSSGTALASGGWTAVSKFTPSVV